MKNPRKLFKFADIPQTERVRKKKLSREKQRVRGSVEKGLVSA